MKKRFYICAALAAILFGSMTVSASNATDYNCGETTTCTVVKENKADAKQAKKERKHKKDCKKNREECARKKVDSAYQNAKEDVAQVYGKTKDGTVKAYDKAKCETEKAYNKSKDGVVKTYDNVKAKINEETK